jgi:hypothetical protein
MPARAERIYIFPCKNGYPGWIMPFPYWWKRSEFINRFQKREIDLGNRIDANFVWVLYSAEAVAWNEECVKSFSSDPLSNKEHVIEEQSKLEEMLRQSQWLLVESYEWESGDE